MVMWIPTVDSKGEIIGYSAESPSGIEWMDGGGYKAYFESDKASVSVAGNGAQSWMLGNSVRLEKHTDGNHEVFFLNGENDRIAVVSGNGPKRTLSQDGEKAVASEGGAQTAEGRSSTNSYVPTPSSEDSGEKMA